MRRSWRQVLLLVTAALALLAVVLSATALATARTDDKTLTSLTDTKALNLHSPATSSPSIQSRATPRTPQATSWSSTPT
jgi:hypothetical protein